MSAIETPCVDICVIDPESRLCRGCLRSIDEITGWSRMSPAARHKIMDELATRAPRLSGPQDGPAPRLKR
ncbi:DUF1289 domain-containing protein [Aliiroseovarius sp. PTFE2010]|uniref:DUF1289 domain-containing protein n=1 Tax=Aliiroseovarius sp. PTFE2010 TaxID=3417190 RepID=UPI003CF17D34